MFIPTDRAPVCVTVFQYNPTWSVGLSLNPNDTLSFLSTNSAESAPLVQCSKLLLVLYILINLPFSERERERERERELLLQR